MKEASGEANLTVVTIILIGVIVAIATPIITSMMSNTQVRACCMDAGGSTIKGKNCYDAAGKKVTMDKTCLQGKTTTK